MPENEAGQVRKAMREARVRCLWFGELQNRYGRRTQWVQGISFGLSSAAVIAIILEAWPEVASVLAGTVAIANAWAAMTNLDQKLVTSATLRTAWEGLLIDYSDLSLSWHEDGARARFGTLQRRTDDLGTLARFGAPWDPKAAEHWERFVDFEPDGEEATAEGG